MKNYLATAFLLPFLFLAFINTIQADTFTIEGNVTMFENGENVPFPGIDVTASSADGQYEAQVLTDDMGNYSMSFDVDDPDSLLFIVSVVDVCTGDFLQEWVASGNMAVYIAFIICSDLDIPDCNAAFGYTEAASLTVGFDDYSSPEGEIFSWFWNFGDGNTSIEKDPTHTFAEGGEYLVTLQIITTDSCESAVTYPVWVGDGGWNANCSFWFFYDFPTDDMLSVYFESVAEGEIVDILWDFGDGNTSNELNPTHIYAAGGVYEVHAEATFFNGQDTCITSYMEHICLDWEVWQECDAWFSNIFVDDANNTVAFFNAAWSNSEILEYAWNFGDGNTSNEANPIHNYAENGIYEVTLSILSADSCSASSTMTIYIDEETQWEGSCQASFYFYNQSPNSTELFFVSTSWAIDSINTWVWDFGDGTTSTEQSPSHEYADFGEYEVTLTITTDDGCESSETYSVWVEYWEWANCQAAFGFYHEDQEEGIYTVQFEDGSWDNPIAWSWDFGDGNTSMEQNPVHIYEEAGAYSVTLEILTADSCSSQMAHMIWLEDGTGGWTEPDCQAMFWFELDDANPLTLNFINMSIRVDSVSAWIWDFGDGTTSHEQNPTHTYVEGGAYWVNLTMESIGCSHSFDMLIWTDDNIFYSDSCQALFQPMIEENHIFLWDMSIGNVIEWTWDLGDGTISHEPFVEHTYAEVGAYTISLTIVTAEGCTSTFEIDLDSAEGDYYGDTNLSTIFTSTEEVIPNIENISLYPNPVQDDLRMDITAIKTADYQIQLIDVTGQIVHTEQRNISTGENSIQIDVRHVSTGMYVLRLQSGQAIKTMKFMKF